MANTLLCDRPPLPELSMKAEVSGHEHASYVTPQVSLQRESTSSNSDTYEISSNDDSDDQRTVALTHPHSTASISSTRIQIVLQLRDDEAEFFAVNPSPSRVQHRVTMPSLGVRPMLNPPSLLTCPTKVCSYPYTDIVEPKQFNLLRLTKKLPPEHLRVQHEPFQHRKLRYRTQRGLLRARHVSRRMKRYLYGRSTLRSHKEFPSLDVQNYRNRLEKSLLDMRQQITEYDQIHAPSSAHRQTISEILVMMKSSDPPMKACMDDYRAKLRPIEYLDKKHTHALISAPFVPRRMRSRVQNIKSADGSRCVDKRFDPSTFTGLSETAEEFFGSDLPFWDELVASGALLTLPCARRTSHHLPLTPKLGFWTRIVTAFKVKQHDLKDSAAQSHSIVEHYHDCTATSAMEKERLQHGSVSPDSAYESFEF